METVFKIKRGNKVLQVQSSNVSHKVLISKEKCDVTEILFECTLSRVTIQRYWITLITVLSTTGVTTLF